MGNIEHTGTDQDWNEGTTEPPIGCESCRQWARIKAQRNLPTSGDTYCHDCGTREADVSRAIKAELR